LAPSRSLAGVTGRHGSYFSSGRSSAAISARFAERERALDAVNRGVLDAEAGLQPLAPLARHRRCDLEPDDVAEAAPADLSSRTASSRSLASSDSSKSASRVTRKAARSRISVPGNSRSRKCASTSSSGTKYGAARPEPDEPR
jgi:hypothetical protein